MSVVIEAHPAACVALFKTRFALGLGEARSPDWLVALLAPEAPAPLQREDSVRTAIRDMLRHGGYKPTGRGKPASEYLVRAAQQDGLQSINPAVDMCNVVALHSGLPVSVVDAASLVPPLRIGLAAAGQSFVFNHSGQVIDVSGLLCLHDATGPCANAVKDAQRTKTHGETTHTLSILWGTSAFRERLEIALAWYLEIVHRLGATTTRVETLAPGG